MVSYQVFFQVTNLLEKTQIKHRNIFFSSQSQIRKSVKCQVSSVPSVKKGLLDQGFNATGTTSQKQLKERKKNKEKKR